MNADYAINNKLTPFISMQNHYNLIYREEEREMFPTLKVCFRVCPAHASPYHRPIVVQRRLYSLVSRCSWNPLQAFDRVYETYRS